MTTGADVGDGFQVDMGALERAAAGVDGTLDEAARTPVSNIPHDEGAFGHDGLAAASSNFLGGWGRGVDNLTTDGREIAARLTANVKLYQKAEQENKAAITGGVLSGSGSDPGEH